MRLKIASINFWGLPWPLSVQKRNRIGKLISFIKKSDLDVICLQEIWRTTDLELIKTRLKEYYFFDASKRKANPSGLVILSKYPIIDGNYVPFWNVHYEFVFRKGMLISSINLKGRKIKIINTHLYTTLYPLKSKIWLRQLTSLYSAINNNPTLIFGDFNYDYNSFPLPELNLVSENNIATRNTNNPYSKRSLNRFSKVNMACDIILSNFELEVKKKEIRKDRNILFSDHYSVISHIKIK